MRFRYLVVPLIVALSQLPVAADAWGAQGHRIVNGAAIRTLPASVPAFLRSPAAHDEIALLGPEADRIKGSGKPLDDDDDPGHFVDVEDDDTISEVVSLSSLPVDRRAYNRALGSASPPVDQYGRGYLPYSIADGWERIVKDLAYWRVDMAGERKAATDADRAFFHEDRLLRETLTLRDIGYWGHFVGDGSQPLHASVHFNGWNSYGTTYPNPNGYSNSHTVHARFETSLVKAVATEDLVVARVHASALSTAPILTQVGAYLTTTASFVPAVYKAEAEGGIDAHSPAATSLVLDRLAAGAAEMRDLIVEAWVASGSSTVGYPPTNVSDIESGAITPSRSMIGLGD
jgi:hypothetical protein